jgi:translation initiation factor IF-2
MTETTAKKKIYQVAKELNLSSETILEYLKKKGHKVTAIMSVVTDPMMTDLTDHFRKDKELAEKHQRKIANIKETAEKTKLKPKPEDDAAKAKAKKLKVDAPPLVEIPAAASAKPAVPAPPEPVEVPEAKVVEAPVQPEVVEPPVPALGEPEVEPVPPAPSKPAPAGKRAPAKTGPAGWTQKKVKPVEEKPAPREREAPAVLTSQTPKLGGLKIKGTVDLDQIKKTTDALEKPSDAAAKAEAAEAVKRKKKKRKIRATEHVTPTAAPVEETEEQRKANKKKKTRHAEVDQAEVKNAIKRTLAEMDETAAATQRAQQKKKRREKRAADEQLKIEEKEREKSILRVTEFVTVNELATLMGAPVAEVIKKCIELGLMVSINQRLEKDTITLVADEFGFQVNFNAGIEEEDVLESEDNSENLVQRPPVVTIMGHVDHGKTSLLDYIRNSNVVAGESGGITQHIGAYSVQVKAGKFITFLDTPGHEAFTAMRARGAKITDIVVLVVAADDNVMPQTVEAISHAQAASVPIIIAINKIDKPDANPDKIRQQLADRNVLVEEWGGKYQCVLLSARTGNNVDLLLEKILLEAEVLDLKANPDRMATGVVIEARVDKGKGVVATVLVQKGTMKIGEAFVAGIQSGKVRAMFDEREKRLEKVGPSMPVQILGFDGVPQAGDNVMVVADDREAREISNRRQQMKREQDFRLIRSMSLDDLSQQIKDGAVKELKVVVKGDVDGSVGALADSLMKITHEEVRVNVIHRAVGAITESDVILAAASGAVIIGFHVRPNLNARRLAEQENVDIRIYNIIYDAINEVKKALEGLLAPEKKEEITATIEVRNVFKVPKIGAVAGCYVQDGKIARGNQVRLVRDGVVVFEGGLASLKRFKDDVREVEAGFECGLGFDGFNDVKVGDVIEAYKVVELQRKLA